MNEMKREHEINAELLSELKAASEIIRVMLNRLTTRAKIECAELLAATGVSPNGMTRAAERDAVIAKTETGLHLRTRACGHFYFKPGCTECQRVSDEIERRVSRRLGGQNRRSLVGDKRRLSAAGDTRSGRGRTGKP